jgi:uncharacterized protein
MLHMDSRDRGRPQEHPVAADATAAPTASEAGSELRFQRCRWCGTSTFRRSLCPTCASTDLTWERSTGDGVVVRRHVPAEHNTSTVTMDEGFTVICRVSGTPPEAVFAGARVHIVNADAPDPQGLPVVELCGPPPLAHHWW